MAGTITVGTISDGTNSGSATDAIKGSARAWVNFNGSGTVAIRASYNVSSITDISTGRYTVNLTTAMADTNYCATYGTSYSASYSGRFVYYDTRNGTKSTTAVYLSCDDGANYRDAQDINVSVFR